MKETAKIRSFLYDFMPLNYKQTSPLDVLLYAFGYPKARINLALVQFVRSETFFTIPLMNLFTVPFIHRISNRNSFLYLVKHTF